MSTSMSKMRQALRKTSDRLRSSSSSRATQRPQHTHPHQQQQQQYHSYAEKPWLHPQYHDAANTLIRKPAELEHEMTEPPAGAIEEKLLDKIQGSMLGMALGDALGAHVEFRPRQYLLEKPVLDLEGGGTWGLQRGQFTDDTSMALCLAISLVTQRRFNPYDQLVRYKWWFRFGYMSSTGQCFDIGTATSQSITEFERRQIHFAKKHNVPSSAIDSLHNDELLTQFNVHCSQANVAGNGALMRLAPVPLFFAAHPKYAVEYSGISGIITHGDRKAYDACRYYGALIVAALQGYSKKDLLDKKFYSKRKDWFSGVPLCPEILSIVEGSFKKKGGYEAGIRGKGYIVEALEAALWAFWCDEDSFEKGALAAVNLGDDTDTTAAIYGQLAGAYYGYKDLPRKWVKELYAKDFMKNLSRWIVYEGQNWQPLRDVHSHDPSRNSDPLPLPEGLTNGYSSLPDALEHTSSNVMQPSDFHEEQLLLKHRDSHLHAPSSVPSTHLPPTVSSHPKVSVASKTSHASTLSRPTDKKPSQSTSNGGALRTVRSVGAPQLSLTVAAEPTGSKIIESNPKSPGKVLVSTISGQKPTSEKSSLKAKTSNPPPDLVLAAPTTAAGSSSKRSIDELQTNNGTGSEAARPVVYHLGNVPEEDLEQRAAQSKGAQNLQTKPPPSRARRQNTTTTKPTQTTKKSTHAQSRK